jgi:hypothetical protein
VGTDTDDPTFQVARRTNVTPGLLVDGVLEILEGLDPNVEVVVRGQSLLEDGARINIVDRTAPLE